MTKNYLMYNNVIKSLYNEKMKKLSLEFHLKVIEIQILMIINDFEQLNTAALISKKMKLLKSQVCMAVKTLLLKEYLTINKDETNKKNLYLSLNDKANNIIECGKKVQNDILSTIFKGFSSSELESFMNSLNHIYYNITGQGGIEA